MRNFGLIFLFTFIIFLPACEQNDFLADDLYMARNAYVERNWSLAERLLERYLREEQNSEKRWEAWELLLKAINSKSQEPRASLECLDAMLVEYENDDTKLAQILSQIAKYNEQLRRYEKAANAWSTYLDLSVLDDTGRVDGYRKLAAMQFNQRHFEAAEDTLQQCLALPIPDHDKIYCMLDMADANMVRERWQDVSDLCQQILDSEPDDTVFGLASYLRGDALEQMENYKEALKQFEMAKDKYPNPAVMVNRIEYLKKQLNQKKDIK